jgi:hypothetical protein
VRPVVDQHKLIALLKTLKSSPSFSQLPEPFQREIEQILQPYATKQTTTSRKRKKPKENIVYQLKISLNGIRPPIWRRVAVPSDITFHDLHTVIQITMGWEDYHLYEFETDHMIIDIPDEVDFFPARKEKLDAQTTKLYEIITEEKQKLTYTYDFGDHWEHTITVEKIETRPDKLEHPVCLKGKRACPPEDIGGIYGYMEIVSMLKEEHPDSYIQKEIESFTEWYGGDYDPEHFDVEMVNERLKQMIAF